MLEKLGIEQGLGSINVLIEDTTQNSIYFNVGMPETLPGGKTAISLDPPPYLLKVSSQVKVEILDSTGRPLYVEYPKEEDIPAYRHGYTDAGSTARLISAHVYPTTEVGYGEIIVVGEALRTVSDQDTVAQLIAGLQNLLINIQLVQRQITALRNAGRDTTILEKSLANLQRSYNLVEERLEAAYSGRTIPTNWRGVYNVRWRKRVYIDRNKPNDSRVVFYRAPQVAVTEIQKPYLSQVYTAGRTETIDNAAYKVRYDYGSNYAIVTAIGFEFTADMAGGELNVPSPDVDTHFYTDERRGSRDDGEYSTYQFGAYTTVIDSIINSQQANVRRRYFGWRIGSTRRGEEREKVYPREFRPSAFTLTYNVSPTYTTSANLKSFAKFDVTKLDTFSGDVHSVKVLQGSRGLLTDYTVVGERVLEDSQILFNHDAQDPSSEYMGSFVGQEIFNMYWATSSIDFSTAQETNDRQPTISVNSNTLLNGMVLSSSIYSDEPYKVVQFVFPTTQSYFQLGEQVELSFKLASNTDEGQFDVYASGTAFYQNVKRVEKEWRDGGRTSATPLVAQTFWKTGRPEYVNERFGQVLASYSPDAKGLNRTAKKLYGQITIPFETEFSGSGSVLFAAHGGEWVVSDVSFVYKKESNFSPSSTTFTIPFEPEQENDEVSFGLKYYNRVGLETVIPPFLQSSEAPPNMSVAQWRSYLPIDPYSNITPWKYVQGGNTFIDGTRNVMTGSLWIASQVGRYTNAEIIDIASGGMELSVDAAPGPSGSVAPGALFRSLGYQGWYRANKGFGRPGFMIYSGTVLYDSGDQYQGVGLELWADNKGLRFRTDTGQLDVTGSIFATDGHFINNFSVGTGSGDQRIEISSSYNSGSIGDLAIIKSANWGQPDDIGWAILGDGRAYFTNVVISGSITASVAEIGGWVVGATDIHSPSGSTVLNSWPAYITMGTTPPTTATTGNGLFLSGSGEFMFGSASGGKLQYTHTEGLIMSSSKYFLGSTEGSYISGSDSNLVISASGFYLDASISGSSIDLSGSINATAGQISGYLLVGNSMILNGTGSGVIQTNIGSEKIVIDGNSNELSFYNSLASEVVRVGTNVDPNSNPGVAISNGSIYSLVNTGTGAITSINSVTQNGTDVAAIIAQSQPTSFSSLGDSIGVYSTAQGFNLSAQGKVTAIKADATSGRTAIGVYATSSRATVEWAGFFDGPVNVTKTALVSGSLIISGSNSHPNNFIKFSTNYVSSSGNIVVTNTGSQATPQLTVMSTTNSVLKLASAASNYSLAQYWNGGNIWEIGHGNTAGRFLFNYNATTHFALNNNAQMIIGNGTNFKSDTNAKLDVNGNVLVTGSICNDDIVYPKLTASGPTGGVTTLTIKTRRIDDTETANNYHLVSWWISPTSYGAPALLSTFAGTLTADITAGTQIDGTALPLTLGSTPTGLQHTLTDNNETITITVTNTDASTPTAAYLLAEVQGMVYQLEFNYDKGTP